MTGAKTYERTLSTKEGMTYSYRGRLELAELVKNSTTTAIRSLWERERNSLKTFVCGVGRTTGESPDGDEGHGVVPKRY